ncbi:hypothetical protein, partial [Pararhodobacter sp. SW119]|uniref:hypothetical protein n=1 Tax=Pararhodobacter sp. SW119 TaxID=2780075 RepID=UPI001AE03E8D
RNLLAICPDERAHHLVESGSQIVHHIARNNAEFARGACIHPDTVDLISGSLVTLDHQFVWITFKEDPHGLLEIRKVALCALDL